MNGHAAILSIGDELLLGQQANTNAGWLAAALADLGWRPVELRTLGDDRAAIAMAMRELVRSCGVIVSTGGLGPTLDDLTRDALGDVVDPGEPLVEDPAGLEHLHAWFTRRGRELRPSNRRQALRPPSAWLLANPFGTAPGVAACWRGGETHAERTECRVFCLPGPPREMEPMFHAHVAPALESSTLVITRTVPEIGLGEAPAADRLGDLMERTREARGLPLVGTTASSGVVRARIRLTALRGDAAGAQAAVDAVVHEVLRAWSPYAFAESDRPLAAALLELLRSRSLTLGVAESCTAGLLGSLLGDVPGASDVFAGGVISYANSIKEALLDVPVSTLAAHGAVSAETARAMVEGCLRRTRASCAIAITGVAGPDGGTDAKPVGTVFIGVAAPGAAGQIVRVRHFRISGGRRDVRERSALLGMQTLRLELLGAGDAPLLWEERA